MTETAKHLFWELDELRKENKALRKSTGFERLSKALHRIADERDKLFEENKALKEKLKTADKNVDDLFAELKEYKKFFGKPCE